MNKAGFDALYREHYHQVLGLCRRMLSRAYDAEDVTQEVFMRSYRALGRYQKEEPFGPWINTIASNYCIDLLRRDKRLSDVFVDVKEVPDTPDSQQNGVDTLINSYRAEAVNQAVQVLPEQYRIPIVLAYYTDASYAQISNTLGITTNHVGILLLRAKQQLRRNLSNLEQEN